MINKNESFITYSYRTSMTEQVPPSPVGGTGGTINGTDSQYSVAPASISPFFTSCKSYFMFQTATGMILAEKNLNSIVFDSILRFYRNCSS